MKAHRRQTPTTSLDAPAGVFFTVTRWQSRPYAQPMIWLATTGCRHVAEHGGCTMCDFGRGDYTDDELIIGLERVLDRLGTSPLIHLAIPGSFLDDREVHAVLRDRILKSVAARGTQAIGIEARPEHIRPDALVWAVRSALIESSSRLSEFAVGTGVEAYDEDVSRVCINKRSSRTLARQALDAVNRADAELPGVDILAEAHVLLKPPVLTEAEAIVDSTAAIEWCFAEGFSRVILMPCSAKPRSILSPNPPTSGRPGPHVDYRPPSLWSVIEVLWRLPAQMRPNVRVHGFASNTPLGLRPTSCPACDQVVTAAIQHFNSTGMDDGLQAVRQLGCECRERWLATCAAAPEGDLLSRMSHFVDVIEGSVEAGGPSG